MERISNSEWQAGREERRSVARKLRAFFGPSRRTRPRDPQEAEALRRAGTPDELIGPVEDPPDAYGSRDR